MRVVEGPDLAEPRERERMLWSWGLQAAMCLQGVGCLEGLAFLPEAGLQGRCWCQQTRRGLEGVQSLSTEVWGRGGVCCTTGARWLWRSSGIQGFSAGRVVSPG